MKKVIMMFTLLVSAQLSQVGYAAAYDPKPVEYRNVVADNVQVEHDRIMDGVDEFIITGKKGKVTEKFRLTCNAGEARLGILYYLKDIYGDKAEGATGMTLQYYPAGAHQMNISIDHPDTLMDSLLTANLAQAVSAMQERKTGTYVFHFYYNDSSFDHVPLATASNTRRNCWPPLWGRRWLMPKPLHATSNQAVAGYHHSSVWLIINS